MTGLFERLRPAKSPGKARGSKGATRKASGTGRAPKRPAVWLNRLLILAGAGVVLAAAGQAWLTVQAIPVQRITVTGELEHTQADAVQTLVQASLQGGFLGADLQRMRAELEGLPWIHRAAVRRRWPAALEIHVTEQLPIARWGEDGFLNYEGGIFHSDRADEWQDLPILVGPEGSAPALMARYQRLRDMLNPLGLTVAELAVDPLGQVDVRLEGGMELALGKERFFERMQRFVSLYRLELVERSAEIERVDLRYERGVAVRFADPSHVAGL